MMVSNLPPRRETLTLSRWQKRFSLVFANLLSALVLSFSPSVSIASESVEPDRLKRAIEEVERADWDNRWTGYGIALSGGSIGLGLGGWALHRRPLEQKGHADPIVFSSSLLLVGASFSQFIHAGLRLDERVQAAKTARKLLKNDEALKLTGMSFLDYRAEAAVSTRLWGGIMTTVQGLATTSLGARLWQKGDSGLQTTGIVLTAMGVVNMGIGAIHFFGHPRSVRIRDRAIACGARLGYQNFQLMAAVSPNGNLVPSLGLFGTL